MIFKYKQKAMALCALAMVSWHADASDNVPSPEGVLPPPPKEEVAQDFLPSFGSMSTKEIPPVQPPLSIKFPQENLEKEEDSDHASQGSSHESLSKADLQKILPPANGRKSSFHGLQLFSNFNNHHDDASSAKSLITQPVTGFVFVNSLPGCKKIGRNFLKSNDTITMVSDEKENTLTFREDLKNKEHIHSFVGPIVGHDIQEILFSKNGTTYSISLPDAISLKDLGSFPMPNKNYQKRSCIQVTLSLENKKNFFTEPVTAETFTGLPRASLSWIGNRDVLKFETCILPSDKISSTILFSREKFLKEKEEKNEKLISSKNKKSPKKCKMDDLD